jgi:hypothetical protein
MNNITTKLNKFQPGSSLSQKGSALVSALIIGLAFFIVIGVTLRWGLTEKTVNKRHVLRHEAKNASESIVEYGFSEMVRQFTTTSSLPSDYLQTNPLDLTDYTFGSFHTGTNIAVESAELYGGEIVDFPLPPGVYINPNDPANEFDPLKGKLVRVQEVTLYGKATSTPSVGNSIDSYTKQTLQVRDAPLLSHFVFYNMDLEMHSGSTMDLGGPVHSNTDIWAMAKPGKPLNVNGTLTSGGRILHGRKANGKHDYTGNVNILDGSGNKVTMYKGGSKSNDESWLDNRNKDWVEEANQSWDGNVQDGDHGVPTLNPLEVLPYIPDDPNTDKTVADGNELENYAYSIIEPVLSTKDRNYKGDNVRAQKFAYKAGLTFEVTKNGSDDTTNDGQSSSDPTGDPNTNDDSTGDPNTNDDSTGDPNTNDDSTGDPDNADPTVDPNRITVDASSSGFSNDSDSDSTLSFDAGSDSTTNTDVGFTVDADVGFTLDTGKSTGLSGNDDTFPVKVNGSGKRTQDGGGKRTQDRAGKRTQDGKGSSVVTRSGGKKNQSSGSSSVSTNGGGKKSQSSSGSSVSTSGDGYSIAAYRYQRIDNEDPMSDLVLDGNGDPIKIYFDSIPANVIGGAIVTDRQFTGIDPTKDANVKDGKHVDTYATDGNNEVIGGMFDKRVDSDGDGRLDVISLNIGTGGLKDAIENNEVWDSGDDSSRPSSWWNGVVYVEFPTEPLDARAQNRTGKDKLVVGAHPTVVLQTINAREIPDPKRDSRQSSEFIDERGMTLATNHPLYVAGSYNADGHEHTNDSTEPDNENASEEPPALLAGDTLTIVSAKYGENREESNESMQWDTSLTHPTDGAHPARSHNDQSYIEISAALITGLAPTYPDGTPNADGTSSGGLHNFPCMIENWGGGIMTIRGSLISLFESEVHPQSRPTNYTSYYRWPTRDFGYNKNFADGLYPPGAPVVRTFRRTSFEDLTEAEYDDAITNLF